MDVKKKEEENTAETIRKRFEKSVFCAFWKAAMLLSNLSEKHWKFNSRYIHEWQRHSWKKAEVDKEKALIVHIHIDK